MMHPCPRCHSRALSATFLLKSYQRLLLSPLGTAPPVFDYQVQDCQEFDQGLLGTVECDECGATFHWNLAAYQARYPQGAPEECPYDHESSPHGCHEDCQACAWFAAPPEAKAP